MGFFTGFKAFGKRIRRDSQKINKAVSKPLSELVAGITGSELAGREAGRALNVSGQIATADVKGASANIKASSGEVFPEVGGLFGMGGGDEIEKDTSVLAPGNDEELRKKKQLELEQAAASNSPGVRQQSVLTAR